MTRTAWGWSLRARTAARNVTVAGPSGVSGRSRARSVLAGFQRRQSIGRTAIGDRQRVSSFAH